MSKKPEYQPLPERIINTIREFAEQGVRENEIGIYVGDIQTATVFLPEPSFRYLTDTFFSQMQHALETGQPFGTMYGKFLLRFDPTLGPGMLEVRGGDQNRATMTIDGE